MVEKMRFPVVLDGSNYLVWSRTARVVLKGRGVWSTHVEAPVVWVGHGEFPTNGGETKWFRDQVVKRRTHEEAPVVEGVCDGDVSSITHAAKGEVNVGEVPTSLKVATVCVDEFPSNREEAKWLCEDQVVLESLRGSLKEEILAVHSHWSTVKELWDGLQAVFEYCSILTRRFEILRELVRLQDGESVVPHPAARKGALVRELETYLPPTSDPMVLSRRCDEEKLMELLLKLNEPFIEPICVLKANMRNGSIWLVNIREENEKIEIWKGINLEEETVCEVEQRNGQPIVIMNQEEDSCMVEVGQEAVQPKDVMYQEGDPSNGASLMRCSWEEEDWGIADPWDEMSLMEENVVVLTTEPHHEEEEVFKEDFKGVMAVKEGSHESDDSKTNEVWIEPYKDVGDTKKRSYALKEHLEQKKRGEQVKDQGDLREEQVSKFKQLEPVGIGAARRRDDDPYEEKGGNQSVEQKAGAELRLAEKEGGMKMAWVEQDELNPLWSGENVKNASRQGKLDDDGQVVSVDASPNVKKKGGKVKDEHFVFKEDFGETVDLNNNKEHQEVFKDRERVHEQQEGELEQPKAETNGAAKRKKFEVGLDHPKGRQKESSRVSFNSSGEQKLTNEVVALVMCGVAGKDVRREEGIDGVPKKQRKVVVFQFEEDGEVCMEVGVLSPRAKKMEASDDGLVVLNAKGDPVTCKDPNEAARKYDGDPYKIMEGDVSWSDEKVMQSYEKGCHNLFLCLADGIGYWNGSVQHSSWIDIEWNIDDGNGDRNCERVLASRFRLGNKDGSRSIVSYGKGKESMVYWNEFYEEEEAKDESFKLLGRKISWFKSLTSLEEGVSKVETESWIKEGYKDHFKDEWVEKVDVVSFVKIRKEGRIETSSRRTKDKGWKDSRVHSSKLEMKKVQWNDINKISDGTTFMKVWECSVRTMGLEPIGDNIPSPQRRMSTLPILIKNCKASNVRGCARGVGREPRRTSFCENGSKEWAGSRYDRGKGVGHGCKGLYIYPQNEGDGGATHPNGKGDHRSLVRGKLDIEKSLKSSLRGSVKSYHKIPKEGNRFTLMVNMIKGERTDVVKDKVSLGEPSNVKASLCDSNRLTLRGSVEMTHQELEERGERVEITHPFIMEEELDIRIIIDNRGNKGEGRDVLNGHEGVVADLYDLDGYEDVRNKIEVKMVEEGMRQYGIIENSMFGLCGMHRMEDGARNGPMIHREPLEMVGAKDELNQHIVSRWADVEKRRMWADVDVENQTHTQRICSNVSRNEDEITKPLRSYMDVLLDMGKPLDDPKGLDKHLDSQNHLEVVTPKSKEDNTFWSPQKQHTSPQKQHTSQNTFFDSFVKQSCTKSTYSA